MIFKRFLYLLIWVFLISCTKQNNRNDFTLHPIQEKMPHANIKSEKLEVLSESEYVNILPEKLQLLHAFLSDDIDDFNIIELSLLTTDAINISAINDSTILILEKDKNRLIQYSLESNVYEIIANQGRGPGDLLFARELAFHDNRAFIGMQGFQISVFDCIDVLCEYEKTLRTDFNNYSLAPNDDSLLFLGISRFGRDQDPDPSNTDQYLIHEVNYEGKLQQSFLPIYDDRAPLVREQMSSGGWIRSFPELKTHVFTFDIFPQIYMYNIDGELIARYQLPGFMQRGYEYMESRDGGFTGRLQYEGSYSQLTFATIVNETWLLLGKRERRNIKFIDWQEGFKIDEWYSYYALNIFDHNLYKIGDDKLFPYGESRVVFVVDQGLVISENGTLYMVRQ